MKKPTQYVVLCCSVLAFTASQGWAQAVPAATAPAPNAGFEFPAVGGSFSYALNVSELFSSGFYNSGVDYTTNLGGDLAYLSSSATHPFSAVYSGGVLIATSSDQPTTTYQNLSLSQTLHTRNWNFQVGDTVSYLPESPVAGLSGIPGVGDLGITPVSVGPAGLGILTTYGPRISNTVDGNVSRTISPHWSVLASAYYNTQQFIGDNAGDGVDNTSEGGSAGVSYRFDVRSALTASYNYSNFSYSGTGFSFSTQGLTIDYSSQWTRKLLVDVYAGPEFISNTSSDSSASSTELAAGASASYLGRTTTYQLAYSRGVNNGSGVLPGSFYDSVTASAFRQFARVWNVSGSFGYTRSTSIPAVQTFAFKSDGVSVGGQVSRHLGRNFAAFGTYTVEQQSYTSNILANNVFSGVYQIGSIGLSYSPRPFSLRR